MIELGTHTLYIGDDITTSKPVQVWSDEDYVRMIEDRLGYDVAEHINLIIKQRNDAIKKLDDEIRSGGYKGGYEDGFIDGYASCMEEE